MSLMSDLLRRKSSAGARRKVPTPVPHTQMPMARDCRLWKCSATATTAGMYIRPGKQQVTSVLVKA